MVIRPLCFANKTSPLQQLRRSYKLTQSQSLDAVRPVRSPLNKKTSDSLCWLQIKNEPRQHNIKHLHPIFLHGHSLTKFDHRTQVRGFSPLAFHLHLLRFAFEWNPAAENPLLHPSSTYWTSNCQTFTTNNPSTRCELAYDMQHRLHVSPSIVIC